MAVIKGEDLNKQYIWFFLKIKIFVYFEFLYNENSVLKKTEVRGSHINQFCSTWGNFLYKTFDGAFFHLPSTCNYIFTSQCKGSYESFNIQLQRQEVDGEVSITRILMKLNGIVVEFANTSVMVMNKPWVYCFFMCFSFQILVNLKVYTYDSCFIITL